MPFSFIKPANMSLKYKIHPDTNKSKNKNSNALK